MTDPRLLRAQQVRLGEGSIASLGPGAYRVRSQSGRGSYTVRLEGIRWSCECADWLDRRLSCKHILTVVEHLADAAGHPLPVPPGEAPAKRRTYAQDWPAYDAAQQAEHLLFDPYLWDLLGTVPKTLKPPGSNGRPPYPLPVQLFCAIRKVHFQESSRRARGLLALTNAAHGILPRVPSYGTPSRVFNEPTTLPILTELVTLAALPIAPLEDGESTSVDSTALKRDASSKILRSRTPSHLRGTNRPCAELWARLLAEHLPCAYTRSVQVSMSVRGPVPQACS